MTKPAPLTYVVTHRPSGQLIGAAGSERLAEVVILDDRHEHPDRARAHYDITIDDPDSDEQAGQ